MGHFTKKRLKIGGYFNRKTRTATMRENTSPSLKDLFDNWFNTPSNWRKNGTIELDDYLNNPLVLIHDELEQHYLENTTPFKMTFEDESGNKIELFWDQKIEVTEELRLMENGKLFCTFSGGARRFDVGVDFRKYLKR